MSEADEPLDIAHAIGEAQQAYHDRNADVLEAAGLEIVAIARKAKAEGFDDE